MRSALAAIEDWMRKALRYWHTLRYLKSEQIAYQVMRRVWRPRPPRGPVPFRRTPKGQWHRPIAGPASFAPPDLFTLLGETGRLNEIGWEGPERSLLWRYNQHYFADLLAMDAGQRVKAHAKLIEDWIAANPPAMGAGWHAYPTSLRIVAWIKWAQAGNILPASAQRSLADQARWLSCSLERHLLGNHLFANAKALIFAGLWFQGPEASHWRDIGLQVLRREFPEQILPDGGHFELSPMYHILATEDVLDLINMARCFAPDLGARGNEALAAWEARVPDMLDWMMSMRHPDGEIAFFNDAAIGIAPTPDQVNAYAIRLGFARGFEPKPGIVHLQESGYARAAAGPAVLLADMAAVGPDYLPGHAHADTLSFELSLYGRRVICNSGTSVYGSGAERLRQRGTAAHSTVLLDGENSSEVWGGFRVARRARVHGARSSANDNHLCLEAFHDGYTRLAGRPRHHRRWLLRKTGLTVTDCIDGRGYHNAEVLFPLAPGWTPNLVSCDTLSLTEPGGAKLFLIVSKGNIELRRFSYHPRFGSSVPNWLATINVREPLPIMIETNLIWE